MKLRFLAVVFALFIANPIMAAHNMQETDTRLILAQSDSAQSSDPVEQASEKAATGMEAREAKENNKDKDKKKKKEKKDKKAKKDKKVKKSDDDDDD